MKEDKNIEKFTKYVIKEVGTETMSNNFLDDVMKSVKLESEKSRIITYKPLIPKSVWGLIIVLFIALAVFVFTGSTLNHYLLSALDFKVIDDISQIDLFKNIHFSKTFTFSFILFSLLVLVQLFVIKNYFNKQNAI